MLRALPYVVIIVFPSPAPLKRVLTLIDLVDRSWSHVLPFFPPARAFTLVARETFSIPAFHLLVDWHRV